MTKNVTLTLSVTVPLFVSSYMVCKTRASEAYPSNEFHSAFYPLQDPCQNPALKKINAFYMLNMI
jgi:hypothetical protein